MGYYCWCGEKCSDDKCKCKWDGWNNVEENLPSKEGEYLVRVAASGDRYETKMKFSFEPRIERGYDYETIYKLHWSEEGTYDDMVIAWKDV